LLVDGDVACHTCLCVLHVLKRSKPHQNSAAQQHKFFCPQAHMPLWCGPLDMHCDNANHKSDNIVLCLLLCTYHMHIRWSTSQGRTRTCVPLRAKFTFSIVVFVRLNLGETELLFSVVWKRTSNTLVPQVCPQNYCKLQIKEM
jgi:hypothetical protein